MQVWVLLFVVLFGGMELFQWVQGLALPLPMFVAAGVILAIASNNDKRAGLPWRSTHSLTGETPKSSNLPQKQVSSIPASPSPPVAPTTRPQRTVELPKFNPQPPQPKSISFTIQKPDIPE